MKAIYRVIGLAAVLGTSDIVFAACTQNNNKLTGLVGLDSSAGTIYATTSSTTNECACTNVRFTSQNTDTKMALSVLLAAKLADKEVRIDMLSETDCNSGYRVYVE